LSQEEFGVKKAREIILEILSEKGFARWSDFEKRLPKATISRALKELEASGLVTKRGRYYVLVTKQYDALIRADYAPALCELIPGCVDPDKLADDLIKEVGEGILKIEEVHSRLLKEKLPQLVNSGVLGGVYSLLLKTLYQNKAIFTIVLVEAFKLILLKKLIDECSSLVAGLPKEYAKLLESVAEGNAKNVREFFGLEAEEVLEPLMKLRSTIIKHGYADVVKIKVFLDTAITLDVKELTSITIIMSMSPFEKAGAKDATKCALTIFEISDNLIRSGCRPLGEKEKESLIGNCKALAEALK